MLAVYLLLPDEACGVAFVASSWSHLVGVVAITDAAFEAKPMKGSPTATATIVAPNPDYLRSTRMKRWTLNSLTVACFVQVRFGRRQYVVQLFVIVWHRLHLDFIIQLSPLQLHVHRTLATDRTLVCDSHELFIAFTVHVVAAWQAYYLFARCKHLI